MPQISKAKAGKITAAALSVSTLILSEANLPAADTNAPLPGFSLASENLSLSLTNQITTGDTNAPSSFQLKGRVAPLIQQPEGTISPRALADCFFKPTPRWGLGPAETGFSLEPPRDPAYLRPGWCIHFKLGKDKK
jgi:hypothetical protein